MKDTKNSRSKRGLMIINLVETPGGYSVVEGAQLLNKPQNSIQVVNPPPVITSVVGPASLPPPLPILKQQLKMTVKQNNLLFLKSPTVFTTPQANYPPPQKIKDQNKCFATWYDQDSVSDIERNEVISWMCEWGLEKNSDDESQKIWVEKYKQHRNIVIKIYNENFAESNTYLSASAIRKYICEDAKWLMKIHMFLTSWGLINAGRINLENDNFTPENMFVLRKSGKYDVIGLDSAYYSKSHRIQNRTSENANSMALKKATKNLRPYCDYCGIHCQIVWFQHLRTMDPKQISTIMKNVNTKNPPLSQKQYEIILCAKCYCNGHFPLLFTHHDFRKVSVNDKLQPGKKRKSGKSKRKQKKQKLKEKQMQEEQQQEKEEPDEVDYQNGKKGKEKQKQEQENENQYEKDEADVNNKVELKPNINGNLNGTKQIKIPVTENKNAQPEKEVNVSQIIKEILASAKRDKIWTFEETKRLLELIEKYGEDWDTIYKNMVKSGYCYDCEPEDLILYFIRLPQMNVSSLIQQNSNECFVNENKTQWKSDFLVKKIQKNFDNSVKLGEMMSKQDKKQHSPQNNKWKELMKKMVNLYITKTNQKIQMLTDLNKLALKQQRKYEQATKEIAQL